MNIAVIATATLATILVALSIAMLINTQLARGLATIFVKPSGIWIAAGIRIFSAVALWYAAPATRFPQVFKILAAIALIAGVSVLFLGHQRVKKIIDWSMNRSSGVLRSYALIAISIGAFVLWALFP